MSNWISHVKNYQSENGISYKDALKQASKTYIKGGSVSSGYVHKMIAMNTFDLNKVKNPSHYLQTKYKKEKVKKVKKVKKETNEDVENMLIENWDDSYLGILFNQSHLNDNMEKLINKKNDKDDYVVDVDLLFFTKSINDRIIKQHGFDVLFEGINEIAEYLGAKNYTQTYGHVKKLPINKYINSANQKLFNKIYKV